MATCEDLEVDRGRNIDYVLTFTDSDSNAVDITGYTIFFTVKSDYDTDSDDSDAVITKTVTDHTSPTNGITTISLSYSDTNIPTGNYFYDITYEDTDSDKITIQEGKFKISYSVTNRSS